MYLSHRLLIYLFRCVLPPPGCELIKDRAGHEIGTQQMLSGRCGVLWDPGLRSKANIQPVSHLYTGPDAAEFLLFGDSIATPSFISRELL